MSFNLNNYNEKLESNEILGLAVWWTIHGGRWSYEGITRKLTQVGLDSEYVQEETPRAVFSDAVKTASDQVDGCIFRKILDDPDRVVMKLIDERVNRETVKVRFDQHTTVALDKDKETFGGEGPMADAVHRLFESYHGTVPDPKVRHAVCNILRDHRAITLRPSGGIYFLPAEKAEVVKAVQAFLRDMKIGELYILRIPNGVIERANTMESVSEDMTGRLDRLSKEVDLVNSRLSSLADKKAEAEEVKKLFDYYVKVLDGSEAVEALHQRYFDLEKKISKKIANFEAAKGRDVKKDKK